MKREVGLCILSPNPNPHLRFAFTDTHSLCYNFIIIPKPSPGHPWCVVQAQVDAEDFFSCDCGAAQIQSVSSLGEKVKGTKNWEIQIETLKDVGDFLKEQLPDIMPENYTAMGESGNPSAGGAVWA